MTAKQIRKIRIYAALMRCPMYAKLAAIMFAVCYILAGCGSLQTAPQGFVSTVDYDLLETRYCGAPKRDANGTIIRRSAVVNAFKRLHPCPSTGATSGACQGWSVDHVLPLANGYCDMVSNLHWLPNVLKSGSGIYPKDRWERKINANPQILVPMPDSGILTIN